MTMPIKPMLLESRDDVATTLNGSGGCFEPKLDGHRGIVFIDADGKAHWYARPGAEKSHILPLLMAELEDRLPPDTVLDGEEVSRDGEWGIAQSVMGSGAPGNEAFQRQVQYAVFDVMRFGGIDTTGLPYEKRREFLEKMYAEKLEGAEHIRLIPNFPATTTVYEQIIEAGFEGAVLKQNDSTYRPGSRGQGWYRFKPYLTIDMVAVRFEEGKSNGKAAGMLGSIITGQYKDGELVERGAIGTGFTDEMRQDIWDRREELTGKVVEARYFGAVGDLAEADPRTMAFLHWRDDKLPEEVVWEVLHR